MIFELNPELSPAHAKASATSTSAPGRPSSRVNKLCVFLNVPIAFTDLLPKKLLN